MTSDCLSHQEDECIPQASQRAPYPILACKCSPRRHAPPQARQRFLEANEASMRAVHDRLSPRRVGLMRLQEAERKRESHLTSLHFTSLHLTSLDLRACSQPLQTYFKLSLNPRSHL